MEQLSIELWGCIFSHLSIILYIINIFVEDEEEQDQASLYTMRLVCKKFNSVFEQHPLLYRDMLLGLQFTAGRLPSLIAWVQLHGRHVQNLAASCHSSPLDAVFTGLYLQGACLQLTSLEHVCNTSLSLLAMFTTLTTCNLHPHHEEVDLQALSVLQQIVDLTIVQGQFSNSDTLAHLIHLQMQDCVATCNADCKSASSLLHINMNESAIVRFHEHGIAACCHLKRLRLQTGGIEAVCPSEHLTFDRQDLRVPESLSALTALTELVVQSRVKNRQLCFGWLSQLTTLRSLHVNA